MVADVAGAIKIPIAPQAAAGHSEGWKRVLGWLQGFAENGETVDTRKPNSAA